MEILDLVMSRVEFDAIDLEDLTLIYGDGPAFDRAAETRYPKTMGQALKEAHVRGVDLRPGMAEFEHWLANTSPLTFINGEPVFYAADMDRMIADLACERFRTATAIRASQYGKTLYEAELANREHSRQMAKLEAEQDA